MVDIQRVSQPKLSNKIRTNLVKLARPSIANCPVLESASSSKCDLSSAKTAIVWLFKSLIIKRCSVGIVGAASVFLPNGFRSVGGANLLLVDG